MSFLFRLQNSLKFISEMDRNTLSSGIKCRVISCPRILLIFIVLSMLCLIINFKAIEDDDKDDYPFINYENNVIENKSGINSFYEKLDKLKKTKKGKLVIVHLGDSHIQYDIFSGELRKLFNIYYGNAGRGLIFPYQIARTTSPASYFSSTNTRDWKISKVTRKNGKIPIGICGISAETPCPWSEININLKKDIILDYNFNKITIFSENNENSFNYSVNSNNTPSESGDFFKIFQFENPSDRINIKIFSLNNNEKYFRLYGVLLENGNSGVLYNSIGINGATLDKFDDMNVINQISYLKPDLLILSLGTNESFNKFLTEENFNSELEKFVGDMKGLNPDINFLFTIPADNYSMKIIPEKIFYYDKYGNKYFKNSSKKIFTDNENVSKIRKVIIDFADNNDYAYWDFYTVMGGPGIMESWVNKSLSQKDHVHFTESGYQLEARLLFEAIARK